MRIGIFGGSFDPVLFVPAARPPHKLDRTLAPAADRRVMLDLATGGHSAFAVSSIELDRDGVSYTVETLRALSSRFPADRLVLLLGPDAVRGLPTWHEPAEIARLAELVTVERESLDDASRLLSDDVLIGLLGRAAVEQLVESRVRMPAVGIRATSIRGAVRAGRSIRYLVPVLQAGGEGPALRLVSGRRIPSEHVEELVQTLLRPLLQIEQNLPRATNHAAPTGQVAERLFANAVAEVRGQLHAFGKQSQDFRHQSRLREHHRAERCRLSLAMGSPAQARPAACRRHRGIRSSGHAAQGSCGR